MTISGDAESIANSTGSTTISDTTAGTYDISISSADYDADTTIQVVDSKDVSALKICVAGDSFVANATLPARIATLTGATLLGTQGGATPHEGYSGWSWADHLGSGPWTDMAQWITDIGGTAPDLMLWNLGTNDTWPCRLSNELCAACIHDIIADAQAVMDLVTAGAPGIAHGIILPPPGATDQAVWDATYGAGVYQRALWRDLMQQYVTLAATTWPALTIHGHVVLSGDTDDGDYPTNNATHPTTQGYNKLARAAYDWILATQ